MLGRQQDTHTSLELRGKVRPNTWSHHCIEDIWSHKIRGDHQSWECGYRRVWVKHRASVAGVWTEYKVDSWKLKESDSPWLLMHRTIRDLKASVLPHGIAPPPVPESKVFSEPCSTSFDYWLLNNMSIHFKVPLTSRKSFHESKKEPKDQIY